MMTRKKILLTIKDKPFFRVNDVLKRVKLHPQIISGFLRAMEEYGDLEMIEEKGRVRLYKITEKGLKWLKENV